MVKFYAKVSFACSLFAFPSTSDGWVKVWTGEHAAHYMPASLLTILLHTVCGDIGQVGLVTLEGWLHNTWNVKINWALSDRNSCKGKTSWYVCMEYVIEWLLLILISDKSLAIQHKFVYNVFLHKLLTCRCFDLLHPAYTWSVLIKKVHSHIFLYQILESMAMHNMRSTYNQTTNVDKSQ